MTGTPHPGDAPPPFAGLTDAELDRWPQEIHRLRGLCYFALDRLPDDEPRGDVAADAVDQLARLAAETARLRAALDAMVILTPQGQPCYRTGHGVPQGMPKAVERKVREVLRAYMWGTA